MRLSEADHARISAAVAQAESATAGEIVVVTARRSDEYRDVALHAALLAMLLVPLASAVLPGWMLWVHARIEPWGDAPSPAFLLVLTAWVQAAVFLVVRYACAWQTLLMALAPRATKARRVRRRALTLFRAAAEKRTVAATGILLYLSTAEHRAELIADASIHDRVAPEIWGDALAVLLSAARDGRPADGIVDAVGRIGAILSEHFPKGGNDVNELADRVIEL